MTRQKFKRLFLVLLGPLVISGAISAIVANNDDGSLNLRCESFTIDFENCRPTGWGDFDKSVAEQAPAWFNAKVRSYENNSFPNAYISASQRRVNNAEILEVSPYLGTREGAGSPLSELRSLSGRRISIVFGVPSERIRELNPLGCNELDLQEASSGVFTAGLCGIPNGVAQVKFSVGPQEQQYLLTLKSAIDREIAERRKLMVQNYLFITPIFVVLFLVISGLVWIIRRAIAYVSAA